MIDEPDDHLKPKAYKRGRAMIAALMALTFVVVIVLRTSRTITATGFAV